MSTGMNDDDRRGSLLGTIKNLRQRELDLAAQQRYLIKAAVMEGATWREIGEAVGTSGQAAWERFREGGSEKIVRLKGPVAYDGE